MLVDLEIQEHTVKRVQPVTTQSRAPMKSLIFNSRSKSNNAFTKPTTNSMFRSAQNNKVREVIKEPKRVAARNIENYNGSKFESNQPNYLSKTKSFANKDTNSKSQAKNLNSSLGRPSVMRDIRRQRSPGPSIDVPKKSMTQTMTVLS